MSDAERRARAERRGSWPIRKHTLSETPREDLSSCTTAEEQIAMMWELTVQALALSGLPMPNYSRGEIPIRIVHSSELEEAE